MFFFKMALLKDVGKKVGDSGLFHQKKVSSQFYEQPINEESYEYKR